MITWRPIITPTNAAHALDTSSWWTTTSLPDHMSEPPAATGLKPQKKASAHSFGSLFYSHVKQNALNPPNYPRSCKSHVNVMLILHVSFYFTIFTASIITHWTSTNQPLIDPPPFCTLRFMPRKCIKFAAYTICVRTYFRSVSCSILYRKSPISYTRRISSLNRSCLSYIHIPTRESDIRLGVGVDCIFRVRRLAMPPVK